jgi:hypothetical protein
MVLLHLALACLAATDSTSLLFMQGNSQELGGNNLWSLDLGTLNAKKLSDSTTCEIDRSSSLLTTAKKLIQNLTGDQDYMFTSDGCTIGGTYYTLWWFLPDPSNPDKVRQGSKE